MKILMVGDGHSEVHERVAAHALKRMGHEVKEFEWYRYFEKKSGVLGHAVNLMRRTQNKYIVGPIVNRLNKEFVDCAKWFHPDMIFIYRGTHITRSVLYTIKKEVPKCVLVGYNNDDPFSPYHKPYLWRHFLDGICEYDLILAYRHSNIPEFRKAGARRVKLLRSWFVPERNYPVILTDKERLQFETDVVFVGHYEADQRLKYLEEIVRQGFRLRIFGHGYDWDAVIRKSPVLRSLAPVSSVWGDEYNRALCGAKIALCFFSKLNRDTYTRRCFEIPASGTLLLSENSDDLATLYREGVEAEFFRDRAEMVRKIRCLLSNDALREAVAKAGHRRVINDRHDVTSRMEQVIQWVSDIGSGCSEPLPKNWTGC